jgi:hypothetical protein
VVRWSSGSNFPLCCSMILATRRRCWVSKLTRQAVRSLCRKHGPRFRRSNHGQRQQRNPRSTAGHWWHSALQYMRRASGRCRSGGMGKSYWQPLCMVVICLSKQVFGMLEVLCLPRNVWERKRNHFQEQDTATLIQPGSAAVLRGLCKGVSRGLPGEDQQQKTSRRGQPREDHHATTVSPIWHKPMPSVLVSAGSPLPLTPPPHQMSFLIAAATHRFGGSVTASYCPLMPPLNVP